MAETPESEGAGTPPAWQRKAFVTVPQVVTAVLILLGIAINFANVISRYVFDFALFWAEEIMVFLILWCVFLGAVAVSFNGDHLKMDLVSANIPSPFREIINGVAVVAFLVCGGFAVVQSWTVVRLFAASGEVSVTAAVPTAIPHTALLVGLALMVVAVLLRVRAYLSNRF